MKQKKKKKKKKEKRRRRRRKKKKKKKEEEKRRKKKKEEKRRRRRRRRRRRMASLWWRCHGNLSFSPPLPLSFPPSPCLSSSLPFPLSTVSDFRAPICTFCSPLRSACVVRASSSSSSSSFRRRKLIQLIQNFPYSSSIRSPHQSHYYI